MVKYLNNFVQYYIKLPLYVKIFLTFLVFFIGHYSLNIIFRFGLFSYTTTTGIPYPMDEDFSVSLFYPYFYIYTLLILIGTSVFFVGNISVLFLITNIRKKTIKNRNYVKLYFRGVLKIIIRVLMMFPPLKGKKNLFILRRVIMSLKVMILQYTSVILGVIIIALIYFYMQSLLFNVVATVLIIPFLLSVVIFKIYKKFHIYTLIPFCIIMVMFISLSFLTHHKIEPLLQSIHKGGGIIVDIEYVINDKSENMNNVELLLETNKNIFILNKKENKIFTISRNKVSRLNYKYMPNNTGLYNILTK